MRLAQPTGPLGEGPRAQRVGGVMLPVVAETVVVGHRSCPPAPSPPSHSQLRGSDFVATGPSLDTNVSFYPHNPAVSSPPCTFTAKGTAKQDQRLHFQLVASSRSPQHRPFIPSRTANQTHVRGCRWVQGLLH